MQLDLVDYIADGLRDDGIRPPTSQSSGAIKRVHFEHGANISERAPRGHSEHGSTARPVMSAHRFLLCLVVLGWSERELARRLGRHQTTVRRWTDGRGVVDRDVAVWLEALAAFHVAHPAPRAANGIGFEPGGSIPVLERGPGSRVA